MREIKFRAWHKKKKTILDVICIWKWGEVRIDYEPISGYESDPKDVTLDKIELMQYTGLKDKNDKEIYEGDILKSYKGIVEVFWSEDEAMFRINPDYTWFDRVARDNKTEVIGNIYENKELLKNE